MNDKSFKDDEKILVDGDFLNRTYDAISKLQLAYEDIDQRLAALEAPSAARQQDFAPGWKNDEEPFMTGVDAPPPDIYFIYPSIENDNKVAVIAQEELIRLVFHYDKAKLEHLIGAALAVLKRMEATPDAKSG